MAAAKTTTRARRVEVRAASRQARAEVPSGRCDLSKHVPLPSKILRRLRYLVATMLASHHLFRPATALQWSRQPCRATMATSDDFVMVPRAEIDGLKSELSRVTAELDELRSTLEGASDNSNASSSWQPDKVERAFDTVDENGDGVLTLDEFRRGYDLLTGDSVTQAFNFLDEDGNGTVDKTEFRKGFALLSSNSARAEAERRKIDAAVAAAKMAAVQEAARNLAEAQLMDRLFTSTEDLEATGQTRWPPGYTPVPGRKPLPRRKAATKRKA